MRPGKSPATFSRSRRDRTRSAPTSAASPPPPRPPAWPPRTCSPTRVNSTISPACCAGRLTNFWPRSAPRKVQPSCPAKAGIQYFAALAKNCGQHGVLDRPPSRTMTTLQAAASWARREERFCPSAPTFWRSVTRTSLLLDSGVLDQLFPKHQLIAHESAELFRRAGERIHAERCELRLDLGLLDNLADLGVKPRHDLLGQIGRTEIALPGRDVEIRHPGLLH